MAGCGAIGQLLLMSDLKKLFDKEAKHIFLIIYLGICSPSWQMLVWLETAFLPIQMDTLQSLETSQCGEWEQFFQFRKLCIGGPCFQRTSHKPAWYHCKGLPGDWGSEWASTTFLALSSANEVEIRWESVNSSTPHWISEGLVYWGAHQHFWRHFHFLAAWTKWCH